MVLSLTCFLLWSTNVGNEVEASGLSVSLGKLAVRSQNEKDGIDGTIFKFDAEKRVGGWRKLWSATYFSH